VRPRRDRTRLPTLVLALALWAGGCGAAGVTPGSSPTAQPSISASTPASTPISASAPGASNVAGASSLLPGVAVDPSLLDVLPSEIGGVALEPDPTTAAQIAGNPVLGFFVEAIAVALAVSPATSSETDFAVVSVLRLRPGAFSNAWFTTYRNSYDAAACDAAGGVRGQPSEVQIGGRTAFVGTCAAEAHTYHVYLVDRNIVVSILTAGPLRFGELVVAGLSE
jgi:hypothetical protein